MGGGGGATRGEGKCFFFFKKILLCSVHPCMLNLRKWIMELENYYSFLLTTVILGVTFTKDVHDVVPFMGEVLTQ